MFKFVDGEDSTRANAILEVGFAKNMLTEQTIAVKKAKYLQDLIKADFVSKVQAVYTRYDLFNKMIEEAQSEIGNKKKSERRNFENIQSFLREDFFGNNKEFKLTKIISCGLNHYGWEFEFEYYDDRISLFIPMKEYLTVENIDYAHEGMIQVAVADSKSVWKVQKNSYNIETIAEAISDYFQLEE